MAASAADYLRISLESDDPDDEQSQDDSVASTPTKSGSLQKSGTSTLLDSSGGDKNKASFSFTLMSCHTVFKKQVKTYRCDVCGASYRHVFSLKRHFLRNHVTLKYISQSDINNCKINIGTKVDQVPDSDSDGKSTSSSAASSNGISSDVVSKTDNAAVLVGLYRCNLCKGLKFDTRAAIREHYQSHLSSPKSRFPCEKCSLVFPHKQALYRHLSSHTEASMFPCSSCSQTFANRSDYLKHASSHADSRTCKYCSKVLSTKANRSRHERIHEGLKPYPCKHCKLEFTQNADLKKHIRKCHAMLYIACNLCTSLFSSKTAMRKHMMDRHQQPYVPQVPVPVASTSTPAKLTSSPAKQGASKPSSSGASKPPDENKIHYCTVCRKGYRSYISMLHHRRKTHPFAPANRKMHRRKYPNRKTRDRLLGSQKANREMPEEDFYKSISNSIAENLLNFVDGKTSQLSLRQYNFSDHAEQYPHMPAQQWSRFNFPSSFDVEQALLSKGKEIKCKSSEPTVPSNEGLILNGFSAFGNYIEDIYGMNEMSDSSDSEIYFVNDRTYIDIRDIDLDERKKLIGRKEVQSVLMCCVCKEKLPSQQAFRDHSSNNHPSVHCTFVEIEGEEDEPPVVPEDLTKEFVSPVGVYFACHVPPSISEVASISCTKCKKLFASAPELHEHILLCGGDKSTDLHVRKTVPLKKIKRTMRKRLDTVSLKSRHTKALTNGHALTASNSSKVSVAADNDPLLHKSTSLLKIRPAVGRPRGNISTLCPHCKQSFKTKALMKSHVDRCYKRLVMKNRCLKVTLKKVKDLRGKPHGLYNCILQKPSENAVPQESTENAILHKHTENTLLKKQTENSILQKQTENFIPQKQTENSIQRLSENAIIQKPPENTSLQKQSENTGLQKQSENTGLQKPSENTILQKPSVNTSLENLAENTALYQLTQNSILQKPTEVLSIPVQIPQVPSPPRLYSPVPERLSPSLETIVNSIKEKLTAEELSPSHHPTFSWMEDEAFFATPVTSHIPNAADNQGCLNKPVSALKEPIFSVMSSVGNKPLEQPKANPVPPPGGTTVNSTPNSAVLKAVQSFSPISLAENQSQQPPKAADNSKLVLQKSPFKDTGILKKKSLESIAAKIRQFADAPTKSSLLARDKPVQKASLSQLTGKISVPLKVLPVPVTSSVSVSASVQQSSKVVSSPSCSTPFNNSVAVQLSKVTSVPSATETVISSAVQQLSKSNSCNSPSVNKITPSNVSSSVRKPAKIISSPPCSAPINTSSVRSVRLPKVTSVPSATETVISSAVQQHPKSNSCNVPSTNNITPSSVSSSVQQPPKVVSSLSCSTTINNSVVEQPVQLPKVTSVDSAIESVISSTVPFQTSNTSKVPSVHGITPISISSSVQQPDKVISSSSCSMSINTSLGRLPKVTSVPSSTETVISSAVQHIPRSNSIPLCNLNDDSAVSLAAKLPDSLSTSSDNLIQLAQQPSKSSSFLALDSALSLQHSPVSESPSKEDTTIEYSQPPLTKSISLNLSTLSDSNILQIESDEITLQDSIDANNEDNKTVPRRKQKCPFCKLDFAYLTTFHRHIMACRQRSTKKVLDEASKRNTACLLLLPKKDEVEESMINLLRHQSRQNKMMKEAKKKDEVKTFQTYTCETCHRIFFSLFKLLQHRVVHKLQDGDDKSTINTDLDESEISSNRVPATIATLFSKSRRDLPGPSSASSYIHRTPSSSSDSYHTDSAVPLSQLLHLHLPRRSSVIASSGPLSAPTCLETVGYSLKAITEQPPRAMSADPHLDSPFEQFVSTATPIRQDDDIKPDNLVLLEVDDEDVDDPSPAIPLSINQPTSEETIENPASTQKDIPVVSVFDNQTIPAVNVDEDTQPEIKKEPLADIDSTASEVLAIPEDDTKDLAIDTNGVPINQSKDVSIDQTKDLSIDQAENVSIDHTEDVSIDQTKNVSVDPTKDVSIDQTKDLSIDKTKVTPVTVTKDPQTSKIKKKISTTSKIKAKKSMLSKLTEKIPMKIKKKKKISVTTVVEEKSVITLGNEDQIAAKVKKKSSGKPKVKNDSQMPPKIQKKISTSPKIKTAESTSPKIKTAESVSPKVKTAESAYPKVKTTESAYPKVKTTESTYPKVKTVESPKGKTKVLQSPKAKNKTSFLPKVKDKGLLKRKVQKENSVKAKVKRSKILVTMENSDNTSIIDALILPSTIRNNETLPTSEKNVIVGASGGNTTTPMEDVEIPLIFKDNEGQTAPDDDSNVPKVKRRRKMKTLVLRKRPQQFKKNLKARLSKLTTSLKKSHNAPELAEVVDVAIDVDQSFPVKVEKVDDDDLVVEKEEVDESSTVVSSEPSTSGITMDKSCPMCGKMFSSVNYRKKHMLLMHKDEQVKRKPKIVKTIGKKTKLPLMKQTKILAKKRLKKQKRNVLKRVCKKEVPGKKIILKKQSILVKQKKGV